MKTVEKLLPGWQIGTTSYLVDWGETVKESYEYNLSLLAPHVSLVQLLLLGKHYLDLWEDDAWLFFLKEFQERWDMSFVVHLPLDLHLWPVREREDMKLLAHLIRRLDVFSPIGYVLHLERSDGLRSEPYVPRREDKGAFRGLLKELEDLGEYPIVLENTHYDLSFFSEEILLSPFGVCFDVGHWWLLGKEIEDFWKKLGSRVRLVHFHGIDGGKDHRSLGVLSEEKLKRTLPLIRNLPVILEVFSFKDFLSSIVVWNLYERR
ncbi:cobamide remodeling phosphodiesterase CbiR [Thermospira aquatica]|uniref:Sugar phosphate isomerase/epimerase n=1 Tax=Thermospira aquatica TaxID=2828656 RepID=A0AAX3BB84_9SPIR|nr:cobamide remodeling phosphodiesterase CbiR [Thermospira aquatica]URA09346.1 hypothetical protein KDW03_07575 [Thermospira aquatica]